MEGKWLHFHRTGFVNIMNAPESVVNCDRRRENSKTLPVPTVPLPIILIQLFKHYIIMISNNTIIYISIPVVMMYT